MSSKYESLVSIVVPCYNVEKYVKKCVDSVISQTYKKLEIILVDDGSTDETGRILDTFKDERITVIHKKNGGLSDARNAGLKIAKGEYICFIDGDDYIDAKYIEVLLKTAEENQADIVACGFYETIKDNATNKENSIVNELTLLNGIDAVKNYLTTKNIGYSMAWNKIYKTKLFRKNNIKYPFGRLHEDEYTTYKLYYFSKTIAIIPDHLYFYIKRNDSIMGKKYSSRNLEDGLAQIEEVKQFINTHDFPDDIKEYLIAYEINVKNYMLKKIRDTKIDTPRKKEIISFLKSHKKDIYTNRYVAKLPKVYYPLLKFMWSKK